MILYIWAKRKNKNKEQGATIIFDLAKYSALDIQRILSNFETFSIISYKHRTEVQQC